MVAHSSRRGPRRDRHPDGGLCAASRARAPHRRRGARRWLQVGPHAALRRPLGGAPARLDRGCTRRPRQRHAGPGDPGPRARRTCGASAPGRAPRWRAPGRGGCGPSSGAGRRQQVDLLHCARRRARLAAAGERAGGPAAESARRRHLHPVPRLRREPSLPRLRAAVRVSPRRWNPALPSLRPIGHPDRQVPELRERPHPVLRRRHAARRGRAAGAVPGLRIGRLDSDALAARRGFETIYDDFAREGRTCWSAPSSPPRASTCHP